MQVDRVGTGLQAGGVDAQLRQDLGPDAHAEFHVLPTLGLVGRQAVVIHAHQQDGSDKVNRLPGRGRGGLRLAGGRGQAIPQRGYLGLDLVEPLGQRLEGLAQFGGGPFPVPYGLPDDQRQVYMNSQLSGDHGVADPSLAP